MDPVVTIDHLTVRYGDRVAVRDVNLRIRPGEISVLIGPSGSGKSTLLRAVNRLNDLVPECRTEGAIRIRLGDGWTDVYGADVDLPGLRRRAAMVFQTPNLLPVSVRKNLALPLRLACGLRPDEIEQRIRRALADVRLLDELEGRLDRSALELSGGQQQRLCLARALTLDPDVLLLDEPTASLDFRATAKIENLLAGLKRRYTILAVSHSLGQTSRLADRCLILRDGALVEDIDRDGLHESQRFQRLVEDVF